MNDERPLRIRWGRLLLIPLLGAGLWFGAPRAPGWIRQAQAMHAQSQQERVKLDLRALRVAADAFTQDTGRYPASWVELSVPPAQGSSWRGPYIKDPDPVDPWGRPYRITTRPSGELAIMCYGADGVVGGHDADADWSDFEARLLR